MTRNNRILLCSALGALGIASTGCNVGRPPSLREVATPESSSSAYPGGPYGTEIGSTIANAQLAGYADAARSAASLQTLFLADFYNPHAFEPTYHPMDLEQDDRFMPTASSYAMAGKRKPTVLLIQVAATWCGPCNHEAKTILPQKHREYARCGGEFLLDLHDSTTAGTPATADDLRRWTTRYRVDYPSAIAPAGEPDPFLLVDEFPNNIIIDTTTMRIIDVVGGEAVPGTCSEFVACSTDADCAACSAGACPSGNACATDADCAAERCTPTAFWKTYESHLDTTRPGCILE
jgi:hypothetical protein